jgi:hypothetical protein
MPIIIIIIIIIILLMIYGILFIMAVMAAIIIISALAFAPVGHLGAGRPDLLARDVIDEHLTLVGHLKCDGSDMQVHACAIQEVSVTFTHTG